MANTYTLIQAQTLASSAASVTFSSIPATYTDLQIFCSARDADTGGAVVALSFNGVTTNLSSRNLTGNGSAASSGSSSSAFAIAARSDSGDRTANTFGNSSFYVPNYAGASYNKPVSVHSAEETNATAVFMNVTAGLWSTTAAITSLTLTPGVANFVIGSSFYLYGIKSS
jgi:hypothetical protein